jgi:hypothetical protein
VDPAKERFVHMVGIMILLSLMVVISFFDVQRVMVDMSKPRLLLDNTKTPGFDGVPTMRIDTPTAR